MAKYRKKPVVIEAVQWTGNNHAEMDTFLTVKHDYQESMFTEGADIVIPTLEGDMIASVNDYVIRGVRGEFYPCKPDIFKQTYEKVED